MRSAQLILAILILASCAEKEKGLLPGLPETAKTITLRKSTRTNSETIIANGTNYIQFEVKYLDEKGWPLWDIDDPFVQIWVNEEWELKDPYRFATEQPGTYEFSLRTNDGRVFSEHQGTVKALRPPQLPAYRLPVIFHYFDAGENPLAFDKKEAIVKFYNDSMTVLNDAFANRLGSKDPNAIDAKIEFYMATEDPQGQVLEYPGFEFVHTPKLTSEWESLFEHAGDGHYWLPSRYVNVWIVSLNGWNGFAFYPQYEETASGYPGDYYGTFIERTTRHMGTTLAHEFAHMLDVWHVFGFDDCNYSDFCDDTHAYYRDSEHATQGEKIIRTSCDYQPFAATNIMDYPFTENNTFTHEQILRMHHALEYSPFLPTERNRANGRKAARTSGVASPEKGRLIID